MMRLASSFSLMLAETTFRVRGLGSVSGFTFVTIVSGRKTSGRKITETWSNKITGANAGVPDHFPVQTCSAARIAQFHLVRRRLHSMKTSLFVFLFVLSALVGGCSKPQNDPVE